MRTEAAGCAGELHMKAPARYAQPRSERRELLLLFSSLRCIWDSDCFWRRCWVLLLRLRPVWRVERVEGRFVW